MVVRDLENQIALLWQHGAFFRSDLAPPEIPGDYARTIVPIEYEGFMTAWVLSDEIGECGQLVIELPADRAEDNYLHTHPTSSRILNVLKGSGWFIAIRNGVLGFLTLKGGDQILMPRDIKHTFLAGSMGMTLFSIHAPFQGLEGEEIIRRSDQQVDLLGILNGCLQLPSLIT